ncbi:MAG: ABC transporter ATP-binding protein [Bacteroidetes bacterium]|jgi:ABC-type multidrug transport system ATPase subunit|nr:ABC transporter ATP-binding protein [Bacteroidota bacterium]MBK7039523.1 ABC transporter ATP-binding protein [Bacteroidota bacterium]MBK9301533.1 ABC transporter ATP-binding protein [Bacteroidota bacterium]MBK9483372.1 ABC transporter ATP-binding protein [Bacteroidota bacterium]
MNQILQINAIKKSYGLVQALNGIGFSVPKGSVFGVLGPNGSGKTTLLGILLNVLKADEGSFTWEGYADAEEARKNIGSLLETPNFYHYLNAVDNLNIVAEIKGKGKENIEDALKKVKLFERRHSKFNTFSLGMKQRLAIASSLIANPDLLVLDEPTNGLDPEGIAEIRELIIRLNREGKTIIMASHLLDEVEKVCTDVAILKKGHLLSVGPVSEVLSDEVLVEVGSDDMTALAQLLKTNPDIQIKSFEKWILISLPQNMGIGDINKYCFENHVVLTHLQYRKRSLESKFIEITQ